jgi:hypothetical protein
MSTTITVGDGSSPAVVGGVTVPNPNLYRVTLDNHASPITVQNLGRGPAVTGAPAGATLTYQIDGGGTGTITVGNNHTFTSPFWLDSTPGATVVQLSGGQFGS